MPADLARVLRSEGYEVIELREVLSVESTDKEVFDHARGLGLLMVTCNRDDFLALHDHAGEEGLKGNINFA